MTVKQRSSTDANRQDTRHKRMSSHSREGNQSNNQHEQHNGPDYSTHISDIRHATTIKHNQVFVLTNSAGDILPQDAGFGIYFRDTCYLDQMELRLQGEHGVPLLADASAGHESVFELTNPILDLPNGETLKKEQLSIRRALSVQDGLTQTTEFHHLGATPVEFDADLVFASHFTNMFTIRGSQPGRRGKLHAPTVRGGHITLAYDGADQHKRTTTISFTPKPDAVNERQATYHIALQPGERKTITLTLSLEDAGPHDHDETSGKQTSKSEKAKHTAFKREMGPAPQIETSNLLFDRALSRSLADLQMLATASQDDVYIAAGVPWYVALFGRDSCITAFEMLAYHPALARSTLRLLARYQGSRYDSFQDEEPGKILHELRVGERANLREVPMIPYYGTVDATPWFLMLLAEYIRWTGDTDLFDELRDNVERALKWIDTNEADPDNIPGYLTYGSRSEKGMRNQGWKDSTNGVVNADSSLCKPPIALVEAQGYSYHARMAMARLFDDAGEHARAVQLERQADQLKQRFNDEFWLGGDTGYAFCLQRDRKPSSAVASNPGQTLFTGITSEEYARAVADRLMQEDMFCGWGVRTLSANERAYNPLDYQTGSVWPHDNALIALGMRRWGFTQPMDRIFTGIFEAATYFPEFRLPEVFDGLSKQQYSRPVHYPVACSPQAWAAGAIPLLLQTALGLEPDAQHGKLRIQRPHLPDWLDRVTCRGLRVADATVDIHYQRDGDTTLVAVLKREGALDVVVEY